MLQKPLTISGLRKELGVSAEKFAVLIGLKSKSRVSEIENGGPVSLAVALCLERLSGGRIDAADLNEQVKAARAVCTGVFHAPADTAAAGLPSSGKAAEVSACIGGDL